MKYIPLFVLCLLVVSCKPGFNEELIERIENDIDLSNYSLVVVTPGAGCPGCISQAEYFVAESKDRDDYLFIFTNIQSHKLLRLKMKEQGMDIDHYVNVIIDADNRFFIPGFKESQYPHRMKVEDGHIVDVWGI